MDRNSQAAKRRETAARLRGRSSRSPRIPRGAGTDLEPQAAVAKRVGRIGTFRHDALASRTLSYEMFGRGRSGDRSRAGVKSNGVIVSADLRYGSRTRDLYRQHPKRRHSTFR